MPQRPGSSLDLTWGSLRKKIGNSSSIYSNDDLYLLISHAFSDSFFGSSNKVVDLDQLLILDVGAGSQTLRPRPSVFDESRLAFAWSLSTIDYLCKIPCTRHSPGWKRITYHWHHWHHWLWFIKDFIYGTTGMHKKVRLVLKRIFPAPRLNHYCIWSYIVGTCTEMFHHTGCISISMFSHVLTSNITAGSGSTSTILIFHNCA